MGFGYDGDAISEQEWAVAEDDYFDLKMGIIHEEKAELESLPTFRFDPLRKCFVCVICGEPIDTLGYCVNLCGVEEEKPSSVQLSFDGFL